MNEIPLWAQIIIAILGSGTVGGIAGAISSSFASRQKIKELEVIYHQKQEESYRSTLGPRIETLYLPLNVHISKLLNQYNKYRWSDRANRQQAEVNFRRTCEDFIESMLAIYDQGMDAYLTSNLDAELRALTFFLRESLDYSNNRNIIQAIKYVCVNHISTKWYYITHFGDSKDFGIYSPISSSTFSKRIDEFGINIKEYIKEVTLGRVPPN